MLHMCTEGFGQLGIVGTFPRCVIYGTVKHTPNEKKKEQEKEGNVYS